MRTSRRRTELLLLATALALAGCGDRGGTGDATAAAVRVEAEGCGDRPSIGGGSFVADQLVLTVAHVVAGSTEVDVELADGSERDATVVAIDRGKDLAVLRVDADVAPLPVGSMRSGARGTFVRIDDGRATSEPFVAAAPVDINIVDIDAADIDKAGSGPRRGYRIQADIEPGDSGSVLVENGAAVAVVFARSERHRDRGWATAISEAADLLRDAPASPVDVGECAPR